MIVVETSTSASPREEREHLVLELALAHLAVRDEDAQAAGRAARSFSAASSIVSTRLWR